MRLIVSPFFVIDREAGGCFSTKEQVFSPLRPTELSRIAEVKESSCLVRSTDLRMLGIGVLQTAAAGELERNQLEQEVDKYFNSNGALCVMPTEKCNLRCVYCYESFRKPRMSQSIADGVKRFLTQQIPKFTNYDLAWFGGEPLLEKELILEISSHYNSVKKKYGVTGTNSITTNAVHMDSSTYEVIRNSELTRFQITVDGPRHLHDSQRLFANRLRGTYDIVLANVRKLIAMPNVRVELRINHGFDDSDASKELVNWLNNTIYPEFEDRLDYKLVPIWKASTTSVDGICIRDFNKFNFISTVRDKVEISSIRNWRSDYLSGLVQIGKQACYAGKPNHYVVGSDGNMYKCTVAFDLPENKIGRIDKDQHYLAKKKELLWTGNNLFEDTTCGSCFNQVSCLGLHCPLTRIQDGKQPCPTEKVFFNSVVGALTTEPQ